MKHTLQIGSVVVAVLAFGSLLAIRQSAPALVHQAALTQAAVGTCAPFPEFAAVTPKHVNLSVTSAALGQASSLQLAPASVRQVLPSVQYLAADWRKFTPEKLTVEPVPGCPVEFKLDHVEEVDGRTVWVGRNEDIPGATYVGVGDADSYTARVLVPGANEYSVRVRGETTTVREIEAGVCGSQEASTLAASTVETSLAVGAPAAAAAETSVSDVVIFFGDEVVLGVEKLLGEKWTTSQTDIENEAIAIITQCNQILVQSGVSNLRWRFAGSVQLPAGGTKLDTMQAEQIAFSQNAWVATKMAEKAADQAILWIWDPRSDVGFAGYGSCPGHHVTTHYAGDSLTTAHELAHNFGCHHDRSNPASGDNAADGDGKYYYGYTGTYGGRTYGTVMSYEPNDLPYFSNPDMTVSSATVVAGTNDQIAIGIAAGNPKAADNARWLRENAAAMAATYTPDTMPAITTQPSAVTITAGQILSVSVTATGGHLTYQWAKDGVAIPGATSATYSKSATTTTDSGSYTVTVSNSLGNVPSNSAAVTVKAATSNTGGSSGGSSGGGGGALEGWFLVAVLALLGVRGFPRRARG